MRTQGQIKHQLKQVIYRHLQRKLRALFKQKPCTCGFNQEILLGGESYVRLCGVTNSMGVPRNVPCDDRIPGCADMARECPLWEPKRSKEDVKAEYHDLIQSKDRGRIAAEYPDIAALLWVLDDSDDVPSESDITEMGGDDEDDPERSGGLWGWLKKLGGDG